MDSHITMSSPDASWAVILAAIEKQGRELRELIEHSVSSINTRLGSIENSLKLVKKEHRATATKKASIATTVCGQDARQDALGKTCQELQAGDLKDLLIHIFSFLLCCIVLGLVK